MTPSPTHEEPWQERFLDKFAVMLERYTTDYDGDQAEEMIDEVLGFISSLLAAEERKVRETAKLLHDKILSGDYRKDVKDCRESGCDHYILGADDFYHDLLALLSESYLEGKHKQV